MSPNLATAYLNECGVTDAYVKEKAGASLLPFVSMESTAIQFYHDWINNDIEGIAVIPALSMDVYALYQVWCADCGADALPLNSFIHHLVRKSEIKSKHKRYVDKNGVHYQRRVLFPCDRLDYSQIELGESIAQFSQSLIDYRKQI